MTFRNQNMLYRPACCNSSHTSVQDVCICPWEGANDLMTGVWVHPGWKKRVCVLSKPKPKPPPYFSASYHPNHTDFPLFRKVPVCTADIIARCVLRRRQRLKPHTFLAGSDGDVGGSLRQGSPISVTSWLHGAHTALQPRLWTLADEASVARPAAPLTQTLPRLYRVYSGRSCSVWYTFFFPPRPTSSAAKPAIFCSFSMPSLLPARLNHTRPNASSRLKYAPLKCCVQSSPQLMLRVSCCTLVERKYPLFKSVRSSFFSLSELSQSAHCLKNTPKELFSNAFLEINILESCAFSWPWSNLDF